MFANLAKLTWQIHENLHPQKLTDFTNHESKFASNLCVVIICRGFSY